MRTLSAAATFSLLMTAVPGVALAALPDDRVDFAMYGRMGVAWTMTGQLITGQSLNLMADRPSPSLGGRFEEGDYLEPTVIAHILKKDPEKPGDTYIDMVMTPAMFARNGSFLGFFSNFGETLRIELFQAYVEAGNVFIPDLIFWGGQRFYRGADVHIADYFYFNDLSGQGGGVKYKGLDLAILVHSTENSPMYYFDSDDTDDAPDIKRQRTMFVAQYSYNFGPRSSFVQGLAEAHVLPPAGSAATPELAPGDFGWVAGAKLHLDLDKGNFNDLSVRFGSRIANGAFGGSRTFQTFGPAEPEGHYDGAYGLEVVEHFLFNLHPLISINGYGLLNISKSAVQPTDVIGGAPVGAGYKTLNWAGGVRGFLYAHKQFHMIAEATVQGRKDGDERMGTAVKLSVVPTIVPTGETSAWGRPHLRAIYTAAIYDTDAVEQRMSSYLRVTGSESRFGHYIGARTEWWF
ncbi:MAG: carbohydrate porin [Polyangiaceae bacterium]|nr:carbohydrate porin [Polyangiaceae bacterium]NUQ72714.1 carbohydrate porin [Polyangiaceae bacterium]